MKALMGQNGCISCGLCANVCPEVFRLDDEVLADVC